MLQTSTKYSPVQYPYSLETFSSEDFVEGNDLGVFAYQSAKERNRSILDVLGSLAWEMQSETFAYRRHGEDTLTRGHFDQWILVKRMSDFLESSQDERMYRQQKYAEIDVIIEQSRLSDLDNFYEYREKAQVKDYLVAHPTLINFLQDSYSQLYKYFGSKTTYTLEIVHDPENTHKILFVYICTFLAVNQALSALNRFDDEWFLDQIDRLDNSINFNIEIK